MVSNIGDTLRKKRKSLNLSIEDVSLNTRISKEYIEAIENEKYDILPAKIYLVNFLRKYCEFLEVDTDSIMHSIKTENPIVEMYQHKVPIKLTYEGKRAENKNSRKIILTGLLIILALLWLRSINFKKSINTVPVRRADLKVQKVLSTAAEAHKKDTDITLKAREETWVRILKDGTLYAEKILPAGYEEHIVFDKKLNIRIGNVLGLDLLNGDEKLDITSGARGGVNDLQIRTSQNNKKLEVLRIVPSVPENKPEQKETQ